MYSPVLNQTQKANRRKLTCGSPSDADDGWRDGEDDRGNTAQYGAEASHLVVLAGQDPLVVDLQQPSPFTLYNVMVLCEKFWLPEVVPSLDSAVWSEETPQPL